MKHLLAIWSVLLLVVGELHAADFVIYANPVAGGGGLGTVCPSNYTYVANYRKTVAQGWGWKPSTNTTVHTVTDTNTGNFVRIEFVGKFGDTGCASESVTVPDPPSSPSYRFSVHFTNAPTMPSNYPLVLSGFEP